MIPIYSYLGKRTECREVPIAFPAQHQKTQPGMEYKMTPRPISENEYEQPGKLEGKSILLTGGDSGIGRATAYALAREGADVAIAYLNEERDACETKEHVEELGSRCVLLPGDLRQKEQAEKVVQKTVGEFGRLDVLINNHGVQFVQRDIRDITQEQMLLTFQTNIFSYFYLVQAARPYLECGSSIINTTSITAYQGSKELIDYSATKGAVVAFTRSLSQSLVNEGIRVNAVAPGPIWTPLIPASFSAEEVETFGTETSKVPMNRAGQPFEIAKCYVFLASDDSSYMTGQVLHPNGGTIVGS